MLPRASYVNRARNRSFSCRMQWSGLTAVMRYLVTWWKDTVWLYLMLKPNKYERMTHFNCRTVSNEFAVQRRRSKSLHAADIDQEKQRNRGTLWLRLFKVNCVSTVWKFSKVQHYSLTVRCYFSLRSVLAPILILSFARIVTERGQLKHRTPRNRGFSNLAALLTLTGCIIDIEFCFTSVICIADYCLLATLSSYVTWP